MKTGLLLAAMFRIPPMSNLTVLLPIQNLVPVRNILHLNTGIQHLQEITRNHKTITGTAVMVPTRLRLARITALIPSHQIIITEIPSLPTLLLVPIPTPLRSAATKTGQLLPGATAPIQPPAGQLKVLLLPEATAHIQHPAGPVKVPARHAAVNPLLLPVQARVTGDKMSP